MSLIQKWMALSCKKAAELVSKKLDGKINPWERYKLKFHNKMCAVCQHFEDQQLFIDKALKQDCLEKSDIQLDAKDKQELKEVISKQE